MLCDEPRLSGADVRGERVLFSNDRELSATNTRQSRYALYTVQPVVQPVGRMSIAGFATGCTTGCIVYTRLHCDSILRNVTACSKIQ